MMVNQKLIKQLCRFGLVGGMATIINCTVFVLLADTLKLQPLSANFLAFLSAFLISYFGHSWWTFKHNHHTKEKLAKFLTTSLMGLALNSGFVWVLMHCLYQSAYVAVLPMVFITPLLIFFINKSWVFNEASLKINSI